MTTQAPTVDLLFAIRQYARIPSHSGLATFQLDDNSIRGSAEFLLPADSQAIVVLRTEATLTSNIGRELIIEGTAEGISFHLECPHVYVRSHVSLFPGVLSLISPVNGAVRIQYGHERPIARVTALLNSFNYRYGDSVRTGAGGFTRIGTPLSVNAGNRRPTFRLRPDHEQLLALVRAGVFRSASLVEIAFDVLPGESEERLLAFTADVAALCTFAAGSGVSVSMLDLLDAEGALVRRVVPQPVTSHYRHNHVVDDFDLSQLFSQCFDEYTKMKESHRAWMKLASYCGSLEDPPFLEQKFAALMMAIEFFVRTSLVEQGQAERSITSLDFPALIGAARKHLGWDIPKHYMARHTIRLLRNAVMHGGEVPTKDATEFRLLFDKWRLFLFRRVLIRLGYRGKVISPHKGWASSSDVADFRQEHNSFTPADPNALDPWRHVLRKLREAQAPASDLQT